MNLFTSSHPHDEDGGIGTGWENSLTDATAFYLASDREGLETYLRLVLGDIDDQPVSVQTQYGIPGGTAYLAIHLTSGKVLLVEHKVDAPLGPWQLERYIEDENHLVAFFAKKATPLSQEVLENPRFIRPATGTHFFWQDLYKSIPSALESLGPGYLRSCFKEYLDYLGFAPSSLSDKWKLLYEDRTVEENQKVHKEFGRKLAGVWSLLEGKGFRVTGVTHFGLQAVPPSSDAGYIHLVIRPGRPRRDLLATREIASEVLRFGVVLDSQEAAEALHARLSGVDGWHLARPFKFGKDRYRVEYVTDLEPLVDLDVEGMLKVCEGVVREIESRTGA